MQHHWDDLETIQQTKTNLQVTCNHNHTKAHPEKQMHQDKYTTVETLHF